MGNNYTPDNAAAGGIVLAHTVNGEHVSANYALVNSTKATGIDTIKQATGFSTAPYKKPKDPNARKPRSGGGKGGQPKDWLPRSRLCKANENTCRGFATKTGYCAGHSRSMGLIDNWNHEGKLDPEVEAKKNLEFRTAQEILGSVDEPD